MNISFQPSLIKPLSFYSLPLLSGFLIGTSFIPFPPWALFFCYVPLWSFALKQNQLKPLCIGGWLSQFVGTMIGFSWVAYTIKEFGFLPWTLAVPGFLIFSGFANLHIPLALFFWFISRKKLNKIKSSPAFRPLLILLLLPLYFALSMEYYPMIFDWHFGYTWLYIKWPAAQTAEIWGFQFLNTLTLFSNMLFLFVFKNFRLNRTGIKKALLTWILCFGGLSFYGQYLKTRWPKPDQTARVLVVQPNIENLSKLYKKSKIDPRPFVLSQLINETKKHFEDPLSSHIPPDFILWPEGAYPYRIKYGNPKKRENFAQRYARKWKTPIVLSATGENNKKISNSLFVFNEKGEMVQLPYNKTILLAFGEYLPGERWLPIHKWLPYYNQSFQKGTGEYKVLNLNGTTLGFQICYEGLFDFFTRDLAKQKAQILVNVTNDSWYGSWQQPWQHLYLTLARAIEVRRPLIRATNTGLSAFVSAKGEITHLYDLNKKMSGIQKVPYYSRQKEQQTTFTLWGYYINQFFLWSLLIGLFIFHCYAGFLDRKRPADHPPSN